jgi:transposase
MLGKPQNLEPKLFYHGVSLEQRMPQDHPLRRIKQLVDFNFIRSQVAHLYGTRGNESVDPAVILKLMFLLYYENIKSERALMKQMPMRMDWLWFCDYDLDEPTPDHSVISKARSRWGVDVFRQFFINILQQCITAGLVDGETVHIDSSTIAADADIHKVRPKLELAADDLTDKLDDEEEAGEQTDEDSDDNRSYNGDTDKTKISEVDPDARIGRKYGKSTLGFKDHRAVDDKHGIVTATATTAANVNDDKVMIDLLNDHMFKTGTKAQTIVADKGYGTSDNYRYLYEHNIDSCIPHQRHGIKSNTNFARDKFTYDKVNDCYICPAGNILKRHDHRRAHGRVYRYRLDRETCQQCAFFAECVNSKKHGRQVVRNTLAQYVEWADNCLSKKERRRLMTRRMHRAEGSFADAANNHGFKRARLRGLEKMQIQNLLIAAIQNLRKLLKYAGRKPAAASGKSCINAAIADFAACFRLLNAMMSPCRPK